MHANADRTFAASYDSATKIISAVISLVLLGIIGITRSAGVRFLVALILAAAYAWSPRSYQISGCSILVRRLIGDVRLPLDDVREARVGSAGDFAGCIRLFGNGGLFGYYGLYSTSKLGKSTWYATNRDHAVVVVTGERTVVFSPDDVDGFLQALPTTSGTAPAVEASPGRGVGMLVGLAAGMIVLALVGFAVVYSPGPPDYDLTAASLSIDDRFYPVTLNAGAVDVENVRVVDFDTDAEWRPTMRTDGFANSHYRSGWFRTAGGKKIRMYLAGGRRLALLPPKGDGTPVLLETKAPEQFVRQVRQEWGNR